MKKTIITSAILATIIISSCGKKTLYCREKDYYYENDKANGKVASNQQRIEYDFTINETAIDSKTGVTVKYTKEYIEQKKGELEASGRFDCTWK